MTVSIATLPPQIQQRYNAKLLSTPEHNLIHQLFATPVELPDNQGFIDRQSRYDRLDLFEVPLVMGKITLLLNNLIVLMWIAVSACMPHILCLLAKSRSRTKIPY